MKKTKMDAAMHASFSVVIHSKISQNANATFVLLSAQFLS
jgi:hypothetical protein